MFKEKAKKILKKIGILYPFQYCYQRIHNADGREIIKTKKIDSNTVLIIRPREDCIEGLMSLFLSALKCILQAEKKQLKFYIDFKKYKSQYFVEGKNAWDLFFKQPIVEDDSKIDYGNCIYSGYTFQKIVHPEPYFSKDIFFNENAKIYSKEIVKKYIQPSEEVKMILEEEKGIIPLSDSLGLYLRGTDYTALKPAGEPMQPTVEQAVAKIDEFLRQYKDIKKIFLVTEDGSIFTKLQEKYNDKLITTSFDSFINNYKGDTFLSKTGILNPDSTKRGREYLAKIFLLSECRYFISSITNGSISAYLLKDGEYADEFIFNLGCY